MKFKIKSAFTLIELLIAITIIAILVGAATYGWTNAQIKARDGKRKNELKSVQSALEFYAHTEGRYPQSQNGKIFCPETLGGVDREINWGEEFKCEDTTLMQTLPQDPGGLEYYYFANPTAGEEGSEYIIWSTLENTKDLDRCNSAMSCILKAANQIPWCGVPPLCDIQTSPLSTYVHYFVISP